MPTQADNIAVALRAIAPEGKLKANEIPLINDLGALWEARVAPTVPRAEAEPAWITVGRRLIGTREIPGPQHNNWIAKGWARLGAGWFRDDETPWCGFFIAHCLDAVGLPFPSGGLFARAKRWATWGVPCSPRLGAIGVKSRVGGGHVFFIVGETADGRFFKALEGNANNMVRIGDIPKNVVTDIRWPQGSELRLIPLPVLPAGTIAKTEG